jgi:hypothetical protein
MAKEWQENTFESVLRAWAGVGGMLPILWNVRASSASGTGNARHLDRSRSCSCDRCSFGGAQGQTVHLRPCIFARLLQWDVQGGLLSGLFLLATVTALIAVWGLYRD